jgi:predicted HD phosphohydrolase
MSKLTISQITDEIFNLYKQYGSSNYIGEHVSQTEHMVLAATCAEKDLKSNNLASVHLHDVIILAAFLHDIGHLLGLKHKLSQMDEWGTMNHDKIGGVYLRDLGFPNELCLLVENHVLAKRFLVTLNPDYYNSLSTASKKTLEYQGGRMTDDELYDFENSEYKNVYIKFRTWEENAKESPNVINSLKKYRDLCKKVLENNIKK